MHPWRIIPGKMVWWAGKLELIKHITQRFPRKKKVISACPRLVSFVHRGQGTTVQGQHGRVRNIVKKLD